MRVWLQHVSPQPRAHCQPRARWLLRCVVAALASVALASHVRAADDKRIVEKEVAYAERASGSLLADLYVPTAPGAYPGVLLVHGGSWKSGNKDQLKFVAERLSHNGFTVMAINYRLAPDHKFPAQIEDCKSAVLWMRRNAERLKLNPQWIAGWGYSAGAHLVSLLGATDTSAGFEGPDVGSDGVSTRIQLVIAGGTPCDLRPFPPEETMLVDFLGATAGEDPKVYERCSPIVYVTKDDPPMFLYHGDADELVPLENAAAMEKALRQAGVETQLYILPKSKHIGAAIDMRGQIEGLNFLKAHAPLATATGGGK